MDATVSRGIACGATLAATTAATMMIASSLERGSPWAGFNAMATAVGARRVRPRFDPAVTPVGLAVLAGTSLGWGVMYERALAATGRRSNFATGALSGALGYVFDRAVLPDRLVPEFRRMMGFGGMFAKYATIAFASAFSGRMLRSRNGARFAQAEEVPEFAEPSARPDLIEAQDVGVQRPPADS